MLGDVLTVRGGKTVEVINTDAEGRLVMADGLVLATEAASARRHRGHRDADRRVPARARQFDRRSHRQPPRAGRPGGGRRRADRRAGLAAPLDRRFRKELDSPVADLKNVGGDYAGAITAALFLEEFVEGLPWAHIDMAGTARSERDESWRSKGATGYGARLLIDFLTSFSPPGPTRH